MIILQKLFLFFLLTKVPIWMVKRMAMEISNGQMGVLSKEISLIMLLMGKEHTNGQTVVFTLENGKKIK
jgi:hypothetical protein